MATANDVDILGNLPLDDLLQLYADVSEELTKAESDRKTGEES